MSASKKSFTTVDIKPLFHVKGDSYFADQCNNRIKVLISRFPVYCALDSISITFDMCYIDLRLLK